MSNFAGQFIRGSWGNRINYYNSYLTPKEKLCEIVISTPKTKVHKSIQYIGGCPDTVAHLTIKTNNSTVDLWKKKNGRNRNKKAHSEIHWTGFVWHRPTASIFQNFRTDLSVDPMGSVRDVVKSGCIFEREWKCWQNFDINWWNFRFAVHLNNLLAFSG